MTKRFWSLSSKYNSSRINENRGRWSYIISSSLVCKVPWNCFLNSVERLIVPIIVPLNLSYLRIVLSRKLSKQFLIYSLMDMVGFLLTLQPYSYFAALDINPYQTKAFYFWMKSVYNVVYVDTYVRLITT